MMRLDFGTATLGVLCLAMALTVACSDDGGDSDGTGGTAGSAGSGGGTAGSGGTTSGTGDGVTPCGNFPDEIPKTCQAGQYCKDEGVSICENGCLSNTNCMSDQTCIKEAGQDVGTCQNNTTGPTCADFCTKVTACDPSVTQAECDQACAGLNDACKTCIVNANCTELNNDPPACSAECGFD